MMAFRLIALVAAVVSGTVAADAGRHAGRKGEEVWVAAMLLRASSRRSGLPRPLPLSDPMIADLPPFPDHLSALFLDDKARSPRRLQTDDGEEEGLKISKCEDTLGLFGSAEAFKSAVECSCSGDLASNYTMTCTAHDYCTDHGGAACMNISYTYHFEIDPTTSRLPDSGYVRRTICYDFTSGDGPGASGELCWDANPQCNRIVRSEHFQTKKNSFLICANQEFCPYYFTELGYTTERAEDLCPTTTLNRERCATGMGFPCGPSTPDEAGNIAVEDPLYVGTADCSNVEPCAGSICRETQYFVAGGDPILNLPVYPQCEVPSSPASREGDGGVELYEPLDLYVLDYYLNYTLASVIDAVECPHDCGVANGGTKDCVLHSRNLIVENRCTPRAKLAEEEGRGSAAHFTDGTRNCIRRYRDQECDDPYQDFEPDENCKEKDVLETCDDSGTIWRVLTDHCVRSGTPVGPFDVPLVARRAYGSREACESHYSTSSAAPVYLESLAPDDPALCQPGQYARNDLALARLPGSVRQYCDGATGEMVTELYSDGACAVQDADEMYVTRATMGGCDPPPYPELGVKEFVRYGVEGCKEEGGGTPEYHCKDLAGAGLGTKIAAGAKESSLGPAGAGGVNIPDLDLDFAGAGLGTKSGGANSGAVRGSMTEFCLSLAKVLVFFL